MILRLAIFSLAIGLLGTVLRRDEPRWHVACDFVESFHEAAVERSPSTVTRTDSAGGVQRLCIFQHPPLEAGAGHASLIYRQTPLPSLGAGETLRICGWIAMSDRIDTAGTPGFDGCEFSVVVDGRVVFQRQWRETRWLEWEADITELAGKTVPVEFRVHAMSTSAADWALWGEPRVEVVGRPWKPREGPRAAILRLDRLDREPVPDRTYRLHATNHGTAVLSVLDPHLDLPTELARWAPKVGQPHVPLAPRLVVGEGADPQNHTLIRVLGRYGIAEVQFLAYPPSVRGGVSVAAGKDAGGAWRIAAAPIADARVREVRVFDLWGVPMAAFTPDAKLQPPYALACGDFLPGRKGHELAIVSGATGRLYSLEGQLLGSFAVPGGGAEVSIARKPDGGRDALLVYRPRTRKAWQVSFGPVEARPIAMRLPEDAPPVAGLYPSAFSGRLYATGPHPDLSRAVVLDGSAARVVDLGAYENLFWFQWYRPIEEGRFVRASDFAHLRTDLATEAARNPAEAADPSSWTEAAIARRFGTRGGFAGYLTDRPKLWEPCFTHRQPKPIFESWLGHKDPDTGMALYPMLTRNGRPVEYGEFGNIDFYASTYAFGLEPLESMYILPLRSFLRQLARPFREKPEHCAGLEPNHEHEIAVEADGSMGDYNLAMVAGFYRYLRTHYGVGAGDLNRVMGTSLAEYFDAPRNWRRGAWDAYDASNPFYKAWIEYNRYVVTRRVAETFREALLAGFPPEIIKCHQIPDTYAVGNLQAFSDITARFTPIDWMLNAGVGFGFTRYGVWYNRPHDALQDAHASGFDAISLGEYQALTPDPETAYRQLRFIFENGGVSVHCMLWPEGHDRGYNDTMHTALARLITEDRPRPGQTGGVGQVRPFAAGGRRFDIACIGTGPERTGLLKSLRADGSWEGSVYVVPFRAHVAVEPLDVPSRVVLRPGRPLHIGPLQGLDSGEQVEVLARTGASGRTQGSRGGGPFRLCVTVLRDGRPLPGLQQEFRVPSGGWFRYILRSQLPTEAITIRVEAVGSSVPLQSLSAYRESEQTTKLARGRLGGRRHRGAVTFDIAE